MSIAIMVNEKFRERIPAWQVWVSVCTYMSVCLCVCVYIHVVCVCVCVRTLRISIPFSMMYVVCMHVCFPSVRTRV